MKKRVLSILFSLVLLSVLVVTPVAATEANPKQQNLLRGRLEEYCSYYESHSFPDGRMYDTNHRYTEVNVPSGYQIGLTDWKEGKRIISLGVIVYPYSRTHYFY